MGTDYLRINRWEIILYLKQQQQKQNEIKLDI